MISDVATLQSELQAMRHEKSTTQERIELYSHRGRGRGRGRGGFSGRVPSQPAQENPEASEGPGRGLSASLRDRLGSREGSEKLAGPKTRRDEHDHRYSRQELNERRYNRQFYRDNLDGVEEPEPQEPLPGSNTDRLASAVVETSQNLEDDSRPSKRSLDGERNPAQQKRNKRLFGNLLGTLQKFQEEDQRFKRSKLAQTRAEAEQRAEQRAQVQTERVRERQKQELAKARLAEINKARELDIKLQVKEKEIALALKVEREMKLTQWLKTAARPPLLWLPAVHTEDTKLLLDQRLTDVTAWRDAQLDKLEKDKEDSLAQYRPILPQVKQAPEKVESEEVDMAEVEPADPDIPVTEATPIAAEDDRYTAEGVEEGEAAGVAEEAEVAGDDKDEPDAEPIERSGGDAVAIAAVEEDDNEAATENASQDVDAINGEEEIQPSPLQGVLDFRA